MSEFDAFLMELEQEMAVKYNLLSNHHHEDNRRQEAAPGILNEVSKTLLIKFKLVIIFIMITIITIFSQQASEIEEVIKDIEIKIEKDPPPTKSKSILLHSFYYDRFNFIFLTECSPPHVR